MGGDFIPLDAAELTVDEAAGTLALRGKIPGISQATRFTFATLDDSAAGRADARMVCASS